MAQKTLLKRHPGWRPSQSLGGTLRRLPLLANPPIGRSDNRFIRWAAVLPPNPAALRTSHPLSVSEFLTEPNQLQTSFRPFSNGTEQLCRTPPPLKRDRFPRSTSVSVPFIAAEAHRSIPPCPFPPRRVTKKPSCSGPRLFYANHGSIPARF